MICELGILTAILYSHYKMYFTIQFSFQKMYPGDSQFKAIAKFISRDLRLCGHSAHDSGLCKTQSTILDTVWTTRMRTKVALVHGGSSAEGTATASSDVDRMAVVAGVNVVIEEKLDKSPHEHNLFFVDSVKCNPGYVRLKASASNILNHDVFGDFSSVLDVSDDGSYLSSDKFVDYLQSVNEPPVPEESEFYFRHGPCLMVEHRNIFGYYRNTSGQLMEADVAFALKCNRWPDEFNEWIRRPRRHNWPSPELIAKISRLDCHAVAVGDPTSSVRSQEWRLSYLMGERELVWSFNDVQIQTYVILKSLRKKHLEPLAADQISSYHLKTIMFWLIEEEGNSRWVEENLLECVNSCLERLQHSIAEGNLQHYFHRRNNLLRHKLGNETEKALVVNEIASIRQNIATYTLNGGLGNTSRVHKLWLAAAGDFGLLLQQCAKDIELTTYFELVLKVNKARRQHLTYFNIFANTSACCDSVDTLIEIRNALEKCLQEKNVKAFETMAKFLDILLGLGYHRLSMQDQDAASIASLQDKCRDHLSAVGNFDDLSGVLYLATFHLDSNKYRFCQDSVERAMPEVGRYLYTGRCSTNLGIEYEAGNIVLSREVPETGEEDEIIHPVFDVVFTKADINFVPYPVKFECALLPEYGDRFFVYHPCVYSHALLFLSLWFRKDMSAASKALEDLAHIVGKVGNSPQQFRALNLLGFCYSMNGNISNAIACYISSLQATSNMTLVTNAAAYHLAVLTFGLFQMFFY